MDFLRSMKPVRWVGVVVWGLAIVIFVGGVGRDGSYCVDSLNVSLWRLPVRQIGWQGQSEAMEGLSGSSLAVANQEDLAFISQQLGIAG